MKPCIKVLFIILFTTYSAQSQIVIDTPQRIDEVLIKAYFSEQSFLKTPASIATLNKEQLGIQNQSSLVSAMNSISGLRMEERTPGSYRLSIRGSILRSPFGVRNVKVYLNELPLTDASGNTYLNVLDMGAIQNIEVLKGPDGSLFGANSGGVVLLNSQSASPQSINAKLEMGSYGALRQNVQVSQAIKNHSINFNQGYQEAEGYRRHSAMRRHFFQLGDQFSYGKGHSLQANVLWADLDYQTPGGLTFAQMQADPKAARAATATLPSAASQQIGIRNKMLFGGLTNRTLLSDQWTNSTSIFGSTVDFQNPFITNYEHRKERNFGFRSYFEWKSRAGVTRDWKLNVGTEWQQSNADIQNFDNLGGVQGNPQASDQVNANNQFYFVRYAIALNNRLNVESSLSLNLFTYQFKNRFPLAQNAYQKKNFDAQWMPRLAMSYQLDNQLVWRASISRGYSTPTISEVRPSNNIVNTQLEAETGWNLETGLRYKSEGASADAVVFRHGLKHSIVNRRLPNDTDYFLNAGGTEQVGVELSGTVWLMYPQYCGVVRGIEFQSAFTYSHFNFKNYQVNEADYSGNALTGVPEQTVMSSIRLLLPGQAYAFIQHNYTSEMPLNDANTVYANSYHLLQAKLGWKWRMNRKLELDIFAGGDNLLNQTYSLGNDLNAVGNRYYNPAALRNYYFGIRVDF